MSEFSPPPLPTSISEEARAMLAAAPLPAPVYPAVGDLEGWRAMVRQIDAAYMAYAAPSPEAYEAGTTLTKERLGGARVYRVEWDAAAPGDGRVFLDFHGGALMFLGGEPVGLMARVMAHRIESTVVSVDYRMPPDHPYPAGLDDGVAAYRALLETHPADRIVIGGTSAGGNLAAATVLRGRDEGLPLPAALVLISPENDLTESGDSFEVLKAVSAGLYRFTEINALYAGVTPLTHPYVSPLFGDFAQGFPPTFLQCGTRDLYLSNTVRMHRALRAAGIAADLHVFEAMPHRGFGEAPEGKALGVELRRFLAAHWGAA